MSELRLPENLVATAEMYPLPRRREWMDALPRTVALLAAEWGLQVGDPYQPGGQCAWVAPARDGSGRDLVLKVGWTHDESLHEADGLRRWNGDGVVQLYRSYAFDSTTALLLERCVPGTTLSTVVTGPDQDVVVAGLLRRLWRAPVDGPFRALESMCRAWADEFEAKLAAEPSYPLDPGLVRTAMALFRELPGTADRTALLCTDLHAQNILAAQREPWLVIDPKPYLGDPAYDPLQHMLNCRDRLAGDPIAYADRMADLLDLDPTRLRLWLFARCVQESIDMPWLCPLAERLRPA